MNKEEILRKAQNTHKDEREIQIKDKSMMWSYITMVIVAAIFSFIRSEKGLPIMDLTATVGFSVSANFIYRFVRTKEKRYLLLSAVLLCVGVISTIRFAMGH